MITIPDSHRDILEKRSLAYVATVDADGTPQVTPVWIEYDGQYLIFNTARGRKKPRNMEARPQVGVTVQDPDNPYRYVGFQGRVISMSSEGAVAHMHHMSQKYTGQDYGALNASEERMIVKIEPTRVWVHD
jgi:PPOX class probable F420-dependent enzyme